MKVEKLLEISKRVNYDVVKEVSKTLGVSFVQVEEIVALYRLVMGKRFKEEMRKELKDERSKGVL
jgi:hypothetical protein